MSKNESGTPLLSEVPNPSKGQNPTSVNNYSAKNELCKPPSSTSFGNTHRAQTISQLEKYFSLGLTPIPLKGKQPLVKWKSWNPDSIQELQQFIRAGVNWGVKTGEHFTVIDFDSNQAFADFVIGNIERLPKDTPIVKTGRGYHLWLRCKDPVRNQHYVGIDIKGEGGYVVAPPSIHANGRHYKFIRAPSETIPEFDIEMLNFPKVKDERQRQPRANSKSEARDGGALGSGRTKEYWDNIFANGVSEGSRHMTLVRLIGWLLFYEGALLDDLLEITAEWNQHNRPPLPKEEVEATVRDCWSRWGTPVPTKTLSKTNRVLIETDECSDNQPELAQAPRQSDWNTEDAVDPIAFCGRKSRIVSKGRSYMSISFFCGRWNCPRCSAHFHDRWVKHLTKVMKDQQLYVLSCDPEDWGRVRRGINRLKADYARIYRDHRLTVILNKAHPESKPLAEDDLAVYLDSVIPKQAYTCPVSTSRGWERTKHNKDEYNDYRLVTSTWLTLPDQISIVEELGGTVNPFHYYQWSSPIDVDSDKWKEQLVDGIRKREKEIEDTPEKERKRVLKETSACGTRIGEEHGISLWSTRN